MDDERLPIVLAALCGALLGGVLGAFLINRFPGVTVFILVVTALVACLAATVLASWLVGRTTPDLRRPEPLDRGWGDRSLRGSQRHQDHRGQGRGYPGPREQGVAYAPPRDEGRDYQHLIRGRGPQEPPNQPPRPPDPRDRDLRPDPPPPPPPSAVPPTASHVVHPLTPNARPNGPSPGQDAGGSWWRGRTAQPGAGPVPQAAAPTLPAKQGRPAPPLDSYLDSALVAQCPRCGEFRVNVRRAGDEYDFDCPSCRHAWPWTPGQDWPEIEVSPRLRPRPPTRDRTPERRR